MPTFYQPEVTAASLSAALDGLRAFAGPTPHERLGQIAETLTKSKTPSLVPVADVNVDTNIQRVIDRNKVAAMILAKAWENPIDVNQHDDDSLWVENGQHRLEAAKQAGRSHILAHVHHHDLETERRLTAQGAGLSALKTAG